MALEDDHQALSGRAGDLRTRRPERQERRFYMKENTIKAALAHDEVW